MDGLQTTNNDRIRVLVVDDEREFTEDLAAFLRTRYEVATASCPHEVLPAIVQASPDVILLDLNMGREDDGFHILEEIRSLPHPPQVLMLTGNREPKTIVRAIKSGAYHYACKPPNMSELINLIDNAARQAQGAARLAFLESKVKHLGGDFVVVDPAMQAVVRQIHNVAPTDSTVLVIGESGTGKELVARYVQELSRRAQGPFVAMNCAGLSEGTAEAELFGHWKGSFTGAHEDKAGLFHQAHGGTLFLDEIGEMPLKLQPRLLRALESGEVRRVGSKGVERVDVRLIAAFSTDLQEAVARGGFHEALFHRLNQYQIKVPPLRKRPEDILPLAEHFLRIQAQDRNRPGLEFSESARNYILGHTWPGNVRGLRFAIQRAAIDSPDDRISARFLGDEPTEWDESMPPYDKAKDEMFDRWQRNYLVDQLDRTRGNVTEAAALSGLNRTSFSRMMRRHGLRAGQDQDD